MSLIQDVQALEDALDESVGDSDDATVHLWCCNPKVALCGHPLTEAYIYMVEVPELECVVCKDLEESSVGDGSVCLNGCRP